jgi:hypothetical protein
MLIVTLNLSTTIARMCKYTVLLKALRKTAKSCYVLGRTLLSEVGFQDHKVV